MGYTKFGEFMRIQRVKNHEVMVDTAKLFGVKLPFVSTVESGRRNVPEEWIPVLIEHYNLTPAEQAELLEAVEHSKTQMKINLTSANNTQRRLAVQFQRSFEKLDEDTAAAIIELLNKGDDRWITKPKLQTDKNCVCMPNYFVLFVAFLPMNALIPSCYLVSSPI